MNLADFKFLAEILKKRSGLTLGEDKIYLIESRLLPVARAHGADDVPALCELLRAATPEALLVEITEAMTTNESSFFRDIKPYENLLKISLPRLMKAIGPKRHMRIWSAACATGQEPYSVAMCLQEDAAKMPGWKFDIIASDLAQKVIDKAKTGIYSQFEVQRGLPIQMLVKYFTALPDTSWQLKEPIRAMVQFRQHNLLEDYSGLGKFDIIFCRNVLIYLDDHDKEAVAEKMARSLQPHGVLIIGATETLVDPKGQFAAVDNFRGAYRLK